MAAAGPVSLRDVDYYSNILPPPFTDSPNQNPSNTGNLDLLNPLMRLKDALEGAQKNTRRMLTKLDKFEQRLDDLDNHMQPIQESTKQYTLAKDNIAATLLEVNKTYEYFRVANDVKEVVQQGFKGSNQKEYFEALIKLSHARVFFDTHREMKSSTSVLNHIEALLSQALGACTTEFEKILGAIGPAAETVEGNQSYQVRNPITPDASRQLKSIIDTFEASKFTTYFKTYSQNRISVIKNELKALEQQHSAEWNMIYSEDPYSKGSHPLKSYLQYSYWLLRGEFQMWGETLPATEESLNCYIAICDACVSDLQRILHPYLADETSAQKKQTTNIVSRQSKLLLMRLDLLSIFSSVYDEYRDICHPDARRESSASLNWKALRDSLISSAVKTLEYLLSAAIIEGFEKKKDDDAYNTCDVHVITGNLLYTSKELLQNYASVYKRAYEMAHSAGLVMSSAVKIPSEVDDAVCAMLENLFVALENRAEKLDETNKTKAIRRSMSIKTHNLFEFEDKAAEDCVLACRKHLFLCNNYYAMFGYLKDRKDGIEGGGFSGNAPSANVLTRRNSFRTTGASKLQKLSLLAEKVESRLIAEEELFCESLAIALGLGAQDMSEFTNNYNRDKSNQNRILKSKFMIINTGIEAFLAQQGEWRVSSAGLRESLSRQLIRRIVPVYTTFFSTYSTVKFSKKHMGEYVKHQPAEVEKHLKTFFGRNA